MSIKIHLKINGIFFLITTLFAFILFACESEPRKSPVISFICDPGYTCVSDSFNRDTILRIGVNANAGIADDRLKYFLISRSINGSPDTAVYSGQIHADSNIHYQYSVYRKLGSKTGRRETFIFTVISQSGLVSSTSLSTLIKY